MDETYIKVGGKDRYLYQAVDKFVIDAAFKSK
jgi:transposase-like protein